MVRRRTRPTKVTSGAAASVTADGTASVVANGVMNGIAAAVSHSNHLLEDQYFASPKRKDCKIDSDCSVADPTSASAAAALLLPLSMLQEQQELQQDEMTKHCNTTKSPSPSKTRAERGGGGSGGFAGRTIGVPLATRSQTRTIENFFKANTAAKNAKLKETAEKKTNNSSNSNTPPNANANNNNHTTYAIYHSSPPHYVTNDDNDEIDERDDAAQAAAMAADFIFDLSEDTNDTELSEEGADIDVAAAIDFSSHAHQQRRSPPSHRDSHSSSSHSSSSCCTTATTENIFLQEPVLTLNVDRSPNQAYSIKINKTLAIEPIFSSPPSLSSVTLNGHRFNQIMTLQNGAEFAGGIVGGLPIKRESSFDCESACGEDNLMLLQPPDNNDNSSCDSGVAFAPSVDSSSGGGGGGAACTGATYQSPIGQALGQLQRRRKPATPHRIVCPSPIKSVPCAVSPVGQHSLSPSSVAARKLSGGGAFAKEQMSPRKSQRHLATAGAVVVSKTRRRLNQQHKEQAPYPAVTTNSSECTAQTAAAFQNGFKQPDHFDTNDVVVIDDDEEEEEEEHDLEFENLEDIKPFCGGAAINNNAAANATAAASAVATKSILNSAKHPTAQQNTTNNNINHTLKAPPPLAGAKSKAKSKAAPPPAAQTKLKHPQQQPLAATNGNRELTDFFPVRRSVRKTKTAVKEEMMRNLEQAVLEERAEGLKVAHFENKGRGIVADRRFQRGEFVVEYVGDLISMTEAAEREKRYALDENAGCYMYYFKHKNQQYCIDATIDTGKLGRLVNHSRTGNLITKVVVVKQRPHLILLARDDIEAGEELTYDYGDRSKESLIHHPWLAF